MYPQGVCRIRKLSMIATAALYFERLNFRIGAKDPLSGGKPLQEIAHLKRERGEFHIHPAVAPVSLMSAVVPFVV